MLAITGTCTPFARQTQLQTSSDLPNSQISDTILTHSFVISLLHSNHLVILLRSATFLGCSKLTGPDPASYRKSRQPKKLLLVDKSAGFRRDTTRLKTGHATLNWTHETVIALLLSSSTLLWSPIRCLRCASDLSTANPSYIQSLTTSQEL